MKHGDECGKCPIASCDGFRDSGIAADSANRLIPAKRPGGEAFAARRAFSSMMAAETAISA